jgi:hypothetical protein
LVSSEAAFMLTGSLRLVPSYDEINSTINFFISVRTVNPTLGVEDIYEKINN